MSDWFFRRGRREQLIDFRSLDAKLSVYASDTWTTIQHFWNSGTSFFARFKLIGWKKLLNELASEGLSLGTGGFVVLYAMALPAFMEFDEGKFLTGQYAVTFLDKNGTEIGQRGILHNDAVPLEEIPDSVIKATMAKIGRASCRERV